MWRRLAASAAATLLFVGTAAGGATATASAAQPSVSMEAVLKAAQWDPAKPDTAVTPGSGPSVRLVEQALKARGLLAGRHVDGHFGTKTVEAYRKWQESLGFRDLDATGLPGKTSLTRLGAGRFTVTRPVETGGRTTWRGAAFNGRTKAMLVEAEELSGVALRIIQGSYNDGKNSAETHLGGGAVDIDAGSERMTRAERDRLLKDLRTVGFAAWYRPYKPDPKGWQAHIHAIALSDPSVSAPASSQAGAYYQGRDGLRGNGPDTGPRVDGNPTWEEYRRSRGNGGGGSAEPGPGSFRAIEALDGRTERKLSNRAVPDKYAKGSKVEIVCQAEGERAYGTTVWDLTSDGLWVADRYVDTGTNGFSSRLPRCEIPKRFPARADLDGRTEKVLSNRAFPDRYRAGEQVPVVCQAHGGPTYHGSTIWDRTADGVWVTDYYVGTGTNGFVPGLPRCDTDAPGTQPDSPDSPDSPDDGDVDRQPASGLRLSDRGAEFIAEAEGFEDEPYGDHGERCTIGHGHKISDESCTDAIRAEWGSITRDEAMDLLWKDAGPFADAVREIAGDVPLAQHEFDALVAFVFNLGAGGLAGSDMMDSLKASPPRYGDVPDELMAYVHSNEVKLCGLYTRRAKEGMLFADGSYDAAKPDCPPGYVE